MKATAFERQFLDMYNALLKIAKSYASPEQLHKQCKRDGWDYNETLDMAYENIQSEAKHAIKGIRINKFVKEMEQKYSPQNSKP